MTPECRANLFPHVTLSRVSLSLPEFPTPISSSAHWPIKFDRWCSHIAYKRFSSHSVRLWKIREDKHCVMSDSRWSGQKVASKNAYMMAGIMWFQMSGNNLLRSRLEVTISHCGRELDSFLWIPGCFMLRKTEANVRGGFNGCSYSVAFIHVYSETFEKICQF